ncbi:MAG: hypothetical protein L3J89_04570 [Gammaproteobacteria bacterium]|nr:hypothetical protein [Gammaproteobacteria bacterium]
MKQKKYTVLAWVFTGMLAFVSPLQASGDHSDGHSHGHDEATHTSQDEMFLKKKEIDGYSVTFHIMKAKPGKEMGGSHDFMIKVEKDGKALTNIVMNTRVKHPDGKAESKKAMKMGDWLMAGYDLGHEGKHQMMILFKTADGMKHKGGVYYSSH